MNKIIFEFLVLIKYFLFIISILGILVLAHRKNLVQATNHIVVFTKDINILGFYQGLGNTKDITPSPYRSDLY